MEIISKYFTDLTEKQIRQIKLLYDLYADWNSKINVISRKDIENLYEKHVLHSMSITKILNFKENSTILDVGTGGGFPGIPLAILFPQVHFHLVDSIGKKIKVASEISLALDLKNVSFTHARVENIKDKYDFVVSRAVMSLPDLVKLTRKNIKKDGKNALPNGLICLKGGDLTHELLPFKKIANVFELSDYFEEEFFETKKCIYIPL